MSLQQLFSPAVGWGSYWHSCVADVLELRCCHVLEPCETGCAGQARKESHSTAQLPVVVILIVDSEEVGGMAAI